MTADSLITTNDILHALAEAFPCSSISFGTTISGSIISVTVWEFTLRVILNERQVSHADKPGEAILTFFREIDFREIEGRSRLIPIARLTTKSPDAAVQFIADQRAYLIGILQLLTSTFDAPDHKEPIPDGIEGLIER